MDYANIIKTATELQAKHNKLEIVGMARALGWRGDHARAPLLQLSLFVATKLAEGQEMPEADQGQQESPEQEAPEQSQGEQEAPEQSQGEQEAPEQSQGEQEQPEQESPEQEQPEQESPEQEQPEQSQGEQEAPEQSQGEQEAPEQSQGEQEAPEQSQGEQESPEQEQPEQSQGEQEQPEPEPEQEYETPDPDEFAALLKKSGIDKPHKLLHKAWLLVVKAKQNLLLVGPAGCGKTMLSQQLAQLCRLPFASVSCSMGMSESQLTGWLLPVGEAGKFDYVPSPFVRSLQQPSIFLLDEMDAADSNVMMVLNSALANGFISIPHKLDNPMVKRDKDSGIIAASNTVGGGDDMYTARSLLDAATLDRFYPLAIDYDAAYERNLFSLDRKTVKRTVKWKPTGVKPDQFYMDTLADTFATLRDKVRKAKLNKVISTRFAQKMIAASMVGIPLDEIKDDLTLGWSDDELVRVGMKG